MFLYGLLSPKQEHINLCSLPKESLISYFPILEGEVIVIDDVVGATTGFKAAPTESEEGIWLKEKAIVHICI